MKSLNMNVQVKATELNFRDAVLLGFTIFGNSTVCDACFFLSEEARVAYLRI